MMFMRITAVILFFFVSILPAQTNLDSLKTAMQNMPDSSIEKVDALNYLGLEYWIVNSNESVDYGKEALALSKKIDYTKGIGEANRIIGVANWTQGNYVNAIKHLNDSNTTFSEIDDDEGMGNAMLNLGMVHAELNDFPKALKLYEDAITKFTKLELDNRVATTFTKMSDIYISQNSLNEAIEYLGNAMEIHTRNDYTYGMAEVHNRLGKLFLLREDKEQAYHHIKQSIMLGKDVNDQDGLVSNLILYGRVLHMDENYDIANDHLKLGLKRANENKLRKYKLEALSALKELKISEGKFDSALLYYDHYSRLKDSIFNAEKANQIAALTFENELVAKNKEVALMEERKRADTLIKWGLFLGVIAITAMGLVIIGSLRQRSIKNKELADRKQELIATNEALNRTALENAKLKQQDLEVELEHRNKELTSYTLNFVQKNEFLNQLQEKIQLAKHGTAEDKAKALDQLSREIKQFNTIDNDWEDFKRHFEEVHTNFYSNLKSKHPGLSANDLKICALTRLNLNTKETAAILGISPESAKTARYRLRKKLELSPEEELLDYFLKIETETI